eukprot:c24123_g13_i1 orf=515-2368(+)
MHIIVHSYALLPSTTELPSVDELIFFTQSCRKTKHLQYARDIHAHACHSGLEDHERLGNHLVPMFKECGSLKDAQQTFNKLVFRNECSWSGLIEAYADCGEPEHALCLYQRMQEEGIYPSRYTFVALLKACASLGCAKRGWDVHMDLARCGFEKDVFVGSSLVDMYTKCGSLAKAQDVFDNLPDRNVSTWTALISGYVEEGHGEQALITFEQMQLQGISPDAYTYVCILKACSNVSSIDQVRGSHAKIVEDSFEENPHVSSTLVDVYAKFGLLAEARAVVDELPSQDVYSWTALIAGCVEHGFCDQALCYFAQMQEEGVSPNTVTFTCSLKSCCVLAAIDAGQAIHIEVTKVGLEKDLTVGNTLVDMYSTCDYLLEAEEVFDKLCNHDVVSWTALIVGYEHYGHGEEALECFEQMQLEGISPDPVTFVCVLKACSGIGAIDRGRQIHLDIERKGLLGKDLAVGNTLINMYAKSGLLSLALQVFDKLPARDLVSWNSLITGYAQLGESRNVFQTLEKMLIGGVKPDSVTFKIVFGVCCRAGLFQVSQTYFEAMSNDYGIVPTLEHHISMVDLLCRVGHVEEAITMIKKVPSSSNLVLWNRVLEACRNCGRLELGKQAF